MILDSRSGFMINSCLRWDNNVIKAVAIKPDGWGALTPMSSLRTSLLGDDHDFFQISEGDGFDYENFGEEPHELKTAILMLNDALKNETRYYYKDEEGGARRSVTQLQSSPEPEFYDTLA